MARRKGKILKIFIPKWKFMFLISQTRMSYVSEERDEEREQDLEKNSQLASIAITFLVFAFRAFKR